MQCGQTNPDIETSFRRQRPVWSSSGRTLKPQTALVHNLYGQAYARAHLGLSSCSGPNEGQLKGSRPNWRFRSQTGQIHRESRREPKGLYAFVASVIYPRGYGRKPRLVDRKASIRLPRLVCERAAVPTSSVPLTQAPVGPFVIALWSTPRGIRALGIGELAAFPCSFPVRGACRSALGL